MNPVKQLRRRYCVSRKQLASDLGISPALIAAAETGVLHWQTDEVAVLTAIADVLLVSAPGLISSYRAFAQLEYESARRALNGERRTILTNCCSTNMQLDYNNV